MMATNDNNRTRTIIGGTSSPFLLFLLFLGLKLAGIIDWSWWWVTIPLWGVLALMEAVAVCVGLIVAVVFVWLVVVDLVKKRLR